MRLTQNLPVPGLDLILNAGTVTTLWWPTWDSTVCRLGKWCFQYQKVQGNFMVVPQDAGRGLASPAWANFETALRVMHSEIAPTAPAHVLEEYLGKMRGYAAIAGVQGGDGKSQGLSGRCG